MKIFFIAFTVLLSSCSSINSQLQEAISYGKIVELNEYSKGIDKQLLVRLFQAPIYNEDCFQETHGVCQYQYFISVSTFDEYPETNIYPLKTQGEIRTYKWLNATEVDTAKLEFGINNYTKVAISNNPRLTPKTSILEVFVSPKKTIELIKDK